MWRNEYALDGYYPIKSYALADNGVLMETYIDSVTSEVHYKKFNDGKLIIHRIFHFDAMNRLDFEKYIDEQIQLRQDISYRYDAKDRIIEVVAIQRCYAPDLGKAPGVYRCDDMNLNFIWKLNSYNDILPTSWEYLKSNMSGDSLEHRRLFLEYDQRLRPKSYVLLDKSRAKFGYDELVWDVNYELTDDSEGNWIKAQTKACQDGIEYGLFEKRRIKYFREERK